MTIEACPGYLIKSTLTLSLSASRPLDPRHPGLSLFFLTADSESLCLFCEAMSEFRGGRVEGANLISYDTPFYLVIL